MDYYELVFSLLDILESIYLQETEPFARFQLRLIGSFLFIRQCLL
ncbi:protein of unknown function [Candidatus Methylacidiphilum fumarolicum]|uniref:Uncharacterized protein n=1 Tax=Candidatus Methylacidiphilum fumarolicum TaxID=591154 RepID=A0ABM9IF14_9BACT|nr:protein of unknown function [Candidatus Methylacidiphilum fumarolicum]